MVTKIKERLREVSHPDRVTAISKFFKTGKGQYGEGDIFIGAYVPDIRKVAKEYKDASFEDIQELLDSEIHEERLLGLFILVQQFPSNKKNVYYFYIDNLRNVNNWDLVDLSADKIVGEYIFNKDKSVLYEFVKSKNVWKRRIAIISTFAFIKKNEFGDALKISEYLLNDRHDLIHKAVGWMLREIGKRNQDILEDFLKKHSRNMPRTMLRYSVEKFDKEKREFYMKR